MDRNSSLRKNPSRVSCEKTIRRILMTEVLEKGKNEHFKTAADFMAYFESLYPASDGLRKQVQRAIRAMNMPKDENGYLIPNKTAEQLEQEKELAHLFSQANAELYSMEDCVPLFLKVNPEVITHLIHEIEKSPVFKNKYLTIQKTFNGLIFYTNSPSKLQVLLNSLITG